MAKEVHQVHAKITKKVVEDFQFLSKFDNDKTTMTDIIENAVKEYNRNMKEKVSPILIDEFKKIAEY